MTWLVFRSEAGYRDAVDLTAAFPMAIDDVRALCRQAAAVSQDEHAPADTAGVVIALSAALDAVRAARRAKHGTPRQPAGFRPYARRGR